MAVASELFVVPLGGSRKMNLEVHATDVRDNSWIKIYLPCHKDHPRDDLFMVIGYQDVGIFMDGLGSAVEFVNKWSQILKEHE